VRVRARTPQNAAFFAANIKEPQFGLRSGVFFDVELSKQPADKENYERRTFFRP
jgi:hypothetical protein